MTSHLIRLLFATAFVSIAAAQPAITVGPYLQLATPTSITVMWRTDVAATAEVRFGTSIGNLTETRSSAVTATNHSIRLDSLQPYTRYYYAVYVNDTFVEGNDALHSFRTFPLAGTEVPIRAWCIGDFGKGNSWQQMVRDAYLNFDTSETHLWLWLGDNAYSDGTEQEYLTKVFDSVYGYHHLMKRLAFQPTPGNHDYNSVSPILSPQPPLQHSGPYYDLVEVYRNAEAGGVPSGHELFYSFDYGNAHFVSLNSEIGSLFNANDDWTGVNLLNSFNGSPMTQWLHQDLSSTNQRWKIVYVHQPPFTDGSHESSTFYEVYMKAIRENFIPICEQYGVDLVVCGHTHVYERSRLIHGFYGLPQNFSPSYFVQNISGVEAQNEAYTKYTLGAGANRGTVYVNNGNSGSKEDEAQFNHPIMEAEYGCDTCCGSFILDINGSRLDGRHLDAHGMVRDHFTIFKVDSVAPVSVNETIKQNPQWLSSLRVMPNPVSADSEAELIMLKPANVVLQLFNMNGELLWQQSGWFSTGTHRIALKAALQKLSKDLYQLRAKSESESASAWVVKLKQ